ncbi:MAG: transporter substrate-binding domain-containing protein [Candidatus Atribacteria bacterium]|nr:transporter substrate-binding domain-containing protein [Candidatus Atribacteria bacterium]
MKRKILYVILCWFTIGCIALPAWSADPAIKTKTPTLRLLTEDYPPITFQKDGKVTGYATEIVETLMKRLQVQGQIELMAWGDAYQIAASTPNVVLFSTTRTPEREKLFTWIGPIGSYNDALYARKGAGLKIASLEDARALRKIGTVRGWFSEQFLREKGFENLVSVDQPTENVKKLLVCEIDLCAFTDITAPDIVKQAGFRMEDLEKVYVIQSYDYFITLSQGTPEETILAWEKAFDQMKADGSLRKIQEKWFPQFYPENTVNRES